MSSLYSPGSYCHVFSVWRHIVSRMYRNIVTCLRNSPGSGARVPGLSLHQVLQSVLYSSKYPLYTRHTRHTWLNTSWTRSAAAWSASGDTPCNQSQLSIVNTLTNHSRVLYLPPGPGWASTALSMYIQPRPQEEVQVDQADHSVTCGTLSID